MSVDALRRGTAAWHLATRGEAGGLDLRGASVGAVDLSGAVLARLRLDRADLSGAILADADLSGARLDEARLVGADLRRVIARGTSARGADFGGADATGADLRGADLDRARWAGATLAGADAREARFTEADLSDLRGRGADLRGARLARARLAGADLEGADLRDADLCGADLEGTRLAGAQFDGAFADGLTRWPAGVAPVWVRTLAAGEALDGLTLTGAGWAALDLRGARLTGATLRHVRAEMADLSGADLRGAALIGGRFEMGRFAEARLAEARLVGVALPWTVFDAVGFGEASLHGVTVLGERVGRRIGGESVALPALAQVEAARFEGAVAAGALAVEVDGWGCTIELAVGRLPASVVAPARTGALARLFGGRDGEVRIEGWPPGARALSAEALAALAALVAAGGRIEGGRVTLWSEPPAASEEARLLLAVGQALAAAFDPRVGGVSVVTDAGGVSLVDGGGLSEGEP